MDSADHPYAPLERARQRRDIAVAIRRARDGVNTIMELSGGSGVYQTAAMERIWRDCTASAAHASFGWDAAMTAYGRALVGLVPPASDPLAR